MKLIRLVLLFLVCAAAILPSPALAQGRASYTIAVVPQSTVSEIFEKWMPFVKKLSVEAGIQLTLKPYNTIAQFEEDLYKGIPDFAYINPYQAVGAKEKQGYIPLVRDTKELVGILVAKTDSGIRSAKDLNGKEIAFPSHAFAANLYMRALLTEQEKISFRSVYVKTHGSGYRSVIMKTAAAAGGVERTLNKEPDDIKQQLTIIYKTPSTAGHPIAAHPRVPEGVRRKVADAILGLARNASATELLAGVQMPDPVEADYQKDYLPLKKLGKTLEKYAQAE